LIIYSIILVIFHTFLETEIETGCIYSYTSSCNTVYCLPSFFIQWECPKFKLCGCLFCL